MLLSAAVRALSWPPLTSGFGPVPIGAVHVITLSTRPCQSGCHALFCCFCRGPDVAMLNSSVPTPLYPHYQQMLALSDVSLTLIYGGYAAGVLISLFGVGNLAGRVMDLRAMILPALLAVLGGALLFSLADSFWSLLLARVLAGIGTGALTARQCGLAALRPRMRQRRRSVRPLFHRRAGAWPVFSGWRCNGLLSTNCLPAHHGLATCPWSALC